MFGRILQILVSHAWRLSDASSFNMCKKLYSVYWAFSKVQLHITVCTLLFCMTRFKCKISDLIDSKSGGSGPSPHSPPHKKSRLCVSQLVEKVWMVDEHAQRGQRRRRCLPPKHSTVAGCDKPWRPYRLFVREALLYLCNLCPIPRVQEGLLVLADPFRLSPLGAHTPYYLSFPATLVARTRPVQYTPPFSHTYRYTNKKRFFSSTMIKQHINSDNLNLLVSK